MKTVTPGRQSASNFAQMASMILHVKNGTQQIRKTPGERANKFKVASIIGKTKPRASRKGFLSESMFLIWNFSNWGKINSDLCRTSFYIFI